MNASQTRNLTLSMKGKVCWGEGRSQKFCVPPWEHLSSVVLGTDVRSRDRGCKAPFHLPLVAAFWVCSHSGPPAQLLLHQHSWIQPCGTASSLQGHSSSSLLVVVVVHGTKLLHRYRWDLWISLLQHQLCKQQHRDNTQHFTLQSNSAPIGCLYRFSSHHWALGECVNCKRGWTSPCGKLSLVWDLVCNSYRKNLRANASHDSRSVFSYVSDCSF